MKTWQQRRDEEAARREEVAETYAQLQRRSAVRKELDELASVPCPLPPAPPAPVADLTERIAERATEIPLQLASQPPAAERCACGHKGISHPRWGACNRLACACGEFRGCA